MRSTLQKADWSAFRERLQTGSYTNKDGATVYTTDVVADRVEFLEWGDRPQGGSQGGFARGASQGGYGQGSKDDECCSGRLFRNR